MVSFQANLEKALNLRQNKHIGLWVKTNGIPFWLVGELIHHPFWNLFQWAFGCPLVDFDPWPSPSCSSSVRSFWLDSKSAASLPNKNAAGVVGSDGLTSQGAGGCPTKIPEMLGLSGASLQPEPPTQLPTRGPESTAVASEWHQQIAR